MTSKDPKKHSPKADSIMNHKNPKIHHLKDAKRNQYENLRASNENEQDRKRKRNQSKDHLDRHSTKRSRAISPVRYFPRSNKTGEHIKVNKGNHYQYNHNRPKIIHIYRERIHNHTKQPTNSSNIKHNRNSKTDCRLKNGRKMKESPLREPDKTPVVTSSATSISSSCQCSCNCYLHLDEEPEEGEIFCKQNDHTNKNFITDSNCTNEKSQTSKRNVLICNEESSSSASSKVPSANTSSSERHRTNNHDIRRKSSRKEYSENVSNQNVFLKFGRNRASATDYVDGNDKNRKRSLTNQHKKSVVKSRIGRSSQRSSSQCIHFPSSNNSSRFQVRRDRHSTSSLSVHDKIRRSTFNVNKRFANKNSKDEKFGKRFSEFEKRPNVVPLRIRNTCTTPSKSDTSRRSSSTKIKSEENRNRKTVNCYKYDRSQQNQPKRQWNHNNESKKTDKKQRRQTISKLDVVLSKSNQKIKYNDGHCHSERKSSSKTTNRFELSRTKETKSDSKLLPEKNKHNQSQSSKTRKRESLSSSSSKNIPSRSVSSSSSLARSDKVNHDSDHLDKKKNISAKSETELHSTQQDNNSKPQENSTVQNTTATMQRSSEELNITETLKTLQIIEKRPKLHFVSKSIQIQMLKEASNCRRFFDDSLYKKLQDILQTDSVPTPTPLTVYHHRDRITRPTFMKLPTTTNLDFQTYIPLQLSEKFSAQMHKLRKLSEALFYS